MKAYSRWTLMVFTAALTGACAGPVPQPRTESEAMARSRMMLARLDRLEADLHSEATATDTFAVLQQRHGEASQIACKVTDEHMGEMHRLLVAQLEKRREKLASRSNKKMAALGRAKATASRGRPAHGKRGRATASARTGSSQARAAASSGRSTGAAPAATPGRAAPAAQGRAPSAAGRATGAVTKTSGALSMR
ncbi:MAG: hypothetical protein NVSMB23_15190 [Myxococcales bacterium]